MAVSLSELHGPFELPVGALWALAGAFLYACYVVLLRARVDHEDKLDLIMFFGGWLERLGRRACGPLRRQRWSQLREQSAPPSQYRSSATLAWVILCYYPVAFINIFIHIAITLYVIAWVIISVFMYKY